MKVNEIKKLSKEQLFSELDKLKKEQFNIRFKKKSGQISNTASIKNVRRTIARVKTFINLGSKKNG
ncbi:MAG: 50S ribosomal protein L29 [Candidatus Fonsibacter sp.]|jgi:large subunit ribosomal protein L29|nr:50S ribosomal protein L29 [Pelagibacterales bacterium]